MLSQISRTGRLSPIPPDPRGIYLDNEGTGGDGSFSDPYGPFSEIPWADIDTDIASGLDVNIYLMQGKTWAEQLVVGSSGTASNSITIQSYLGDSGTSAPIIDASLETNGILLDGRSYVTIDGIVSNDASVINFRVNGPSTGVSIINCTSNDSAAIGFGIIGTAANPIEDILIGGCTSNNSVLDGIRLAYIDNSTIKNNYTDTSGRNGIFALNSYDNVIEKNYVGTSTFSGISIDGALSTGNKVRFNYVYRGNHVFPHFAGEGGIRLALDSGSNEVFSNILSECTNSILLNNSTPISSNLIYNNTIADAVGFVVSIVSPAENAIFKNNIISKTVNSTDNLVTETNVSPSLGIVFDYNIHYSLFYDEYLDFWQWNNIDIDWAGWQSEPTVPPVGNMDANGDYIDPKFTGDVGFEYTLQATSPCISAADTISGFGDRIHPTSTWPNDVRITPQPTTVGAYAYIP